jgi:5-methyltetrahydrofolate--homocysteine methyltransferase
MSEEIIQQLRDAVVGFDADRARGVTQTGVDSGLDPLEMIDKGIRAALDVMGERFSSGELFLPELMLAAEAADAAVAILEPELLKCGGAKDELGKVLMATVKGDIHDIGKNIVSLLMRAAGFGVVDIGVDKTGEEILVAARKHEVDVIGLSALLTTTMPRVEEFVELLQESGVRNQYKVIIGGAPVTQEYADLIGADGYGADATHAVKATKKLLA